MTEFEPQRGKFAGHGIEVTFIRRFIGDRREDVIESVKVGGRPLVVIDPEDREAVRQLWTHTEGGSINDLQAALRKFANPTPPKPEEPMGLGAVVEDGLGQRWVRKGLTNHGEDWALQVGNAWVGREYAHIDVTRVLSEGVSDA